MAIKKTHNFDIEMVLNELGHDYSDFVEYLNSKKVEKPIEQNQPSAIFVIDEFIKAVERNGLMGIKSVNTTKYYLSFLLRFKEYLSKRHKDILFIDINEIVFGGFIETINQINKCKLKHSTFNTYISILKRMCTYAAENELTNKNINYRFKKISTTLLPRYLNQSQIAEIIKETKLRKNTDLWATIFIILLGTGLRVSEISHLKIEDVNLEKKLIYTLGKGKKERYIPIYPEVERAILLYLKRTKGDIRTSKGFLFSRQLGNVRRDPISVRSIQNNFLIISRKIGLDDRLTIHSFRHTFAVNCLKVGMQPNYLAQILGHESLSTTTVYTQLLPTDLQAIIDEKYPMPFEKLIKQLLE